MIFHVIALAWVSDLFARLCSRPRPGNHWCCFFCLCAVFVCRSNNLMRLLSLSNFVAGYVFIKPYMALFVPKFLALPHFLCEGCALWLSCPAVSPSCCPPAFDEVSLSFFCHLFVLSARCVAFLSLLRVPLLSLMS